METDFRKIFFVKYGFVNFSFNTVIYGKIPDYTVNTGLYRNPNFLSKNRLINRVFISDNLISQQIIIIQFEISSVLRTQIELLIFFYCIYQEEYIWYK